MELGVGLSSLGFLGVGGGAEVEDMWSLMLIPRRSFVDFFLVRAGYLVSLQL